MINCIHSLTMHSHKIISQVNIYKRQLLFSCSVISDIAMSWTAARQASLSLTISQSLLKLKSIESIMPSNHLLLCRLLLSVFHSIRVFSNGSALHIRGPKYCGFSFSISPCNEYSLLPLGCINNKVQLISPGNHIQYSVITHNGKEYEKE